jgi:hypothetical protein
MTSATKAASKGFTASGSNTLGAKLAQAAYTVAATVLMLEMRDALNAKSTADQSDAAFTYGL